MMSAKQRFLRGGLHVAVLSAALGLAIPGYAIATPVTTAAVNGSVYWNSLNPYTASEVSGSLSDPQTTSWTYDCDFCAPYGYGFTATGAAKVITVDGHAGVLGAKSTLSVTSGPPTGSLGEVDSYAQYDDYLTVTSDGRDGDAGVLVLKYTVDGALNHDGAGYNESFASLGLYGGVVPHSSMNGGALTYSSNQSFELTAPWSGATAWTEGPTGDSATVEFYVPITFGTQFWMEPTLRAAARFDYRNPEFGPYTASADFYSTATLTSALVYDGTATALGSLLSSTIDSTSGFIYGPDGLTTGSAPPPPHVGVPEPSALWLFVLGLGGLGLARRTGSGSRLNPPTHHGQLASQ